jgi:hypothetical protein
MSWAVAATGDLNGDGFSDLSITAGRGNTYIYHGSPTGVTLAAGPIRIPFFSAGVGDANGDGYGDLLIAGRFFTLYFAQILLGGDTPVSLMRGVPISPRTSGELADFPQGWVGSAGDMNGDGLGDWVVSHYGASRWALGSASSTTTFEWGGAWFSSIDAIPEFDGFSFGTVGIAGDLNGDGYTDMPIGFRGGQSVEVFFGSGTGPRSTPAIVLRASPIETRSRRGYACGIVGDLDGDGYDDLAIGEGGIDTSRLGQVLIYYGGSSLSSTPDDILIEPRAFGAFGLFRLASLFNVNNPRDHGDSRWLRSAKNTVFSM